MPCVVTYKCQYLEGFYCSFLRGKEVSYLEDVCYLQDVGSYPLLLTGAV